MEIVHWHDFAKIELRVGTIVQAEEFKEARKPAYILHVDFGEEIGTLKSSAQITDLYSIEDLYGKQVIAVVNFAEKQIGPIMSQCLVTGLYTEEGGVVLCVPDKPIQNGAKLG